MKRRYYALYPFVLPRGAAVGESRHELLRGGFFVLCTARARPAPPLVAHRDGLLLRG